VVLSDSITISIVEDSLELDRSAGGLITGYAALVSALEAVAVPVPEPASVVCLVGAVVLLPRRRLRW
jgi:hypothetical protein